MTHASTQPDKVTMWQMISDADFEAEATRRGYKLTDLDDFQYEAHQDHNNGMHDDIVSDCPDCGTFEARQVDKVLNLLVAERDFYRSKGEEVDPQ